ncbi:Leucine-rich repeat and WD repeat-containing protein 1 [Schistosoma japonicum]|nr:Leucine-rich repeat and WD repeat-containing protein 1 [Schistosoma japonicum]
MSKLIDELVAQGFEIIRDDSGQDLVKLVFMDENDDATGCALVTPEDAKKILSGQATLQNVVDEEGKQVLTLTPIANSDLDVVEESKAVLPDDHSTSSVPVSLGKPESHNHHNNEQVLEKTDPGDVKPDQPSVSNLSCESGGTVINSGEIGTSEVAPLVESVEQYTLNEQTAVVDNNQVQVVTIVDSRGEVLDQKQGQAGEQIILEMHGQAFSYEVQGPTSTGEPITSTLLISTSDQDVQDISNTNDSSAQQSMNGQTNWSEGVPNCPDRSHVTSGFDEATEATPPGQQFTLTEATTLVDGDTLQLVLLSDENGNVLDQKQGHTGDHVIIDMNGSSLEYVFLGPTETGEPILTTLVVTTETEMAENTQSNFNNAQESPSDTEAGSTVAKWCPPGLPSEFYAILRRQAEVVVATRVPRFSDSPYRPEPYHRKLGPYTAYVEMLEMVNSYRVGASQGETLELYEALRNYAKIYRPSGPHSRALTKYELALNEAAAQICRFQPGLLFHKRDLYHLAKETVERSQTLLNTERRQQNQQLQQQQAQQTQVKQNMHSQRQTNQSNLQNVSKPKVSVPTTQPPRTTPQTVAVGGRVASSQLAMLESRGLSGIQHSSTVASTANSVPTIHENTSSDGSIQTLNIQCPTTNTLQSSKPRTMPNESNVQYLSTLSIAKRDSVYKLLPNEEEAIRVAAIDVLSDMPQLQIKQKADCTNIERACWDQARQLASQTLGQSDYHSGNSSGDHISQVQSLVCNELRLDSVREAAALYGRLPGGIQPPNVAGLPRSTPVPVLTPYEVACNEAASYLASGLPSLLTHRRELAELAKKVVRNSGCIFTHTPTSDKLPIGGGGYRFYCSDQLLELDLSAAEQLLSNPLDGSDSPDSGCDASLEGSETDVLSAKCESLVLSCQECNNVVDDITIFISTGTDSLKKVRILNLSDCGFTGIVPAHLNQCVNLVELNLSGNALYAFPRCLHLPKLRRLNLSGNPNLLRSLQRGIAVEPPLVEQFPRLVTLDLDPELASLLSSQSLAYLCPYLKTINGKDFVDEPNEETISAAQTAKNSLSTLIYSKWEDDIAGFYKKGLPKRDTICVIETLVLHAVNRSLEISQPFTHCKNILARRIAEDFLAPKMLDDDCEDETVDKFTHNYISDDEGAISDSDLDTEEEDDSYCKENSHIEKNSEIRMSEHSGKSNVQSNSCAISRVTMPRKPKKVVSTEASQASVAEREALAAAANLTLLPDEPPNRLINVVGQALRHGKTVVYEVMRTAARQPDGELIPVGGLGTTASSINSATLTANSHMDVTSKGNYEDAYDESDTEDTSFPESTPVCPPTSLPSTSIKTTPVITKLPTKQSSGTRRPGLLNRVTYTPTDIKSNRGSVISSPSKENTVGVIPTITQRRLKASDYIIKPSTSSSGTAYIVANVTTQSKPTTPSTVNKRGRPPVAQSLAKKAALAESEAAETDKLIKNVTIPPPHAPPPSTMRMSTRDSNRHKRFSAYGVIDTAAALAGKEEALLAAVLAQEDSIIDKQETLLKDSSVVLSEYDAAAAEAVAAIAKEAEVSEHDDQLKPQPKVSLDPSASEQIEELPVASKDNDEGIRKKRKRLTGPQTPHIHTESPTVNIEPTTPATNQTLTRKRTAASPKLQEPKKKSTSTHSPLSVSVNLTPIVQPTPECKRSLSQLGEIVDYDPLHFIRCHARDNDPLDCETKVWRCAFEPSVNDPQNETSTIVATCGGECVCLIDCKSGRVMKRFKHFGEEFYTLAWTTVEMAAGHKTNLLAAAGKLREIRLLHPEQLVCYAEMRGHKDDVACMIFHPEKPTILFSGDSKACILVWDIGIPSAPEYKTRHQLLMRLVCPRANLNPVLNLVFLKKYDALIAGCEDGIFSWTLKDFRKEKLSDEKEAEIELKVPTRREPCFDGLAQLSNDLIVTKCVEEGEIYVINFGQVVSRRRRVGGSNKKAVNVEIRGQLRWHTTEEIYINVTARPGLHAVICGDNEGTIWLYDLQKQVIDESENRKFKSKPIKILEWPECSIGGAKDEDSQVKESITSGFKNPVVNTTDISYDGQYLVAVTDNNLVCIWKFSG